MTTKSTIVHKNGDYILDIAKDIYKETKIGDNICDIADKVDNKLEKDGYLYVPISIEPDYIVANNSPVRKSELTKDAVFSFTLQVNGHKKDKDKYPLKYGSSFAMDGNNYFYLIKAVNEACQAGMKACGPDVKLISPSKVISEILDSYEIESASSTSTVGATKKTISFKTLLNSYSLNLENSKKIVPNYKSIPSEVRSHYNLQDVMREDELYYIDVYGTNLPEHTYFKNYQEYPSMFSMPKIGNKKQHSRKIDLITKKHKNSLKIYQCLSKNFVNDKLFSLRKMIKLYPKLDMKDVGILHELGLCRGYPIQICDPYTKETHMEIAKLHERQKVLLKQRKNQSSPSMTQEEKDIADKIKELQKNNAVVVHFGHSILINSKGSEIIC